VWHNRKLLALWEVGGPYLMDFPSLNTLGSYIF
jgi:carotenoid cleavage dioxygenase-like enzyme